MSLPSLPHLSQDSKCCCSNSEDPEPSLRLTDVMFNEWRMAKHVREKVQGMKLG